MHRIFDKTDKGREEISTRKYRLAPRLRTLLLLIDGKQNTGQLLQKIAGLDETSIDELLDGEFIKDVEDNEDIDDSNEIVTVMPFEIDETKVEETETPAAKVQEESLPEPAIAEDAPSDSDIFALAEGETKFQAIHKFYTDNIRTTLGLRGYNFQLKVDQAQSIEELQALHESYIAAVLKARGDVIARDQHLRLEQLFNLEETSDQAE
ncbi:MAG: hypothetical protein ACXWJF_12230 [Burkholderiaceae bacterium]